MPQAGQGPWRELRRPKRCTALQRLIDGSPRFGEPIGITVTPQCIDSLRAPCLLGANVSKIKPRRKPPQLIYVSFRALAFGRRGEHDHFPGWDGRVDCPLKGLVSAVRVADYAIYGFHTKPT